MARKKDILDPRPGRQLGAMMALTRLEAAGLLKNDFSASGDPDLRALGAIITQVAREGEQAFRDTGTSRRTIRKLALG